MAKYGAKAHEKVERALHEEKRGELKSGKSGKTGKVTRGKDKPPPITLDHEGTERFTALKAWRAEVAKEHGLPAYVIFHDATLAEMARAKPTSLDEMSTISGVGTKKLEAYGREILRVLALA